MKIAKTQAEINLAKDIKTNKQRFFSHIRDSIRKLDTGPLCSEDGVEIKIVYVYPKTE